MNAAVVHVDFLAKVPSQRHIDDARKMLDGVLDRLHAALAKRPPNASWLRAAVLAAEGLELQFASLKLDTTSCNVAIESTLAVANVLAQAALALEINPTDRAKASLALVRDAELVLGGAALGVRVAANASRSSA